jgi:hypothetical protein
VLSVHLVQATCHLSIGQPERGRRGTSSGKGGRKSVEYKEKKPNAFPATHWEPSFHFPCLHFKEVLEREQLRVRVRQCRRKKKTWEQKRTRREEKKQNQHKLIDIKMILPHITA